MTFIDWPESGELRLPEENCESRLSALWTLIFATTFLTIAFGPYTW